MREALQALEAVHRAAVAAPLAAALRLHLSDEDPATRRQTPQRRAPSQHLLRGAACGREAADRRGAERTLQKK